MNLRKVLKIKQKLYKECSVRLTYNGTLFF